MKRTQIQLDERSFEALRERAFRKRTSVAEEIRQLVWADVLHTSDKTAPKKRQFDFSFVGKGKSRGIGSGDISLRHDDEFADTAV